MPEPDTDTGPGIGTAAGTGTGMGTGAGTGAGTAAGGGTNTGMAAGGGAVPGAVADAVRGNWVDTRAPAWARPWLRLSRADRPVGTWLLLIPCWWGLLLACLQDGRAGLSDLWIAVGCAIGAFLMRGAGCTWNDITDRDIDGQVARTRSRPIPSGQVSPRGAFLWAIVQALLAFLILLTFPKAAIWLGVAALVPVAIYPFAKRFTWWPQAFLGIAFNWGALLGWTAHAGSLGLPAVVLYLGGIAWTLFYDTIYAHQDAEDDALIGVKSTARLFGQDSALWLRRFLVAAVCLTALAALIAGIGGDVLSLVIALAGPWAFGWHLAWQLARFAPDDPDRLLVLFRSNRDAGLILVLFFAGALAV
jgi:4-hydroxybenzoate polyprenyltransferase